jgi:hypothetical protein
MMSSSYCFKFLLKPCRFLPSLVILFSSAVCGRPLSLVAKPLPQRMCYLRNKGVLRFIEAAGAGYRGWDPVHPIPRRWVLPAAGPMQQSIVAGRGLCNKASLTRGALGSPQRGVISVTSISRQRCVTAISRRHQPLKT